MSIAFLKDYLPLLPRLRAQQRSNFVYIQASPTWSNNLGIRDRVPVPNSDLIQCLVIHAKLEATIFLFNKEDWCPVGEVDLRIKPLAQFSCRQVHRAANSGSDMA